MPVASQVGESLAWYEASLPSDERKQRGHFSTPPLLVEKILDACGYIPTANLSQIRVLDPACGSGNFLAGAARRLITSVGAQCMVSDECGEGDLLAHYRRNLWGCDPDPISCFLTEMQLRSVFEQTSGQPLPDQLPLHIHQRDGLACAWEACSDLLLANPPYLAAKNTDLSAYRRAERSGQIDSYLLFLDVALQAVRPDGWLGLVLPDPLLARSNASLQRTRLLEECTIHHLWHLSGIFRAEVGAVVLIAQKNLPAKTHSISWTRSEPGRPRGSLMDGTVAQVMLQGQPRGELRYLLSTEPGRAVERLRTALETPASYQRTFAPLDEFVTIHRGEECGKESCLLTEHPIVQEHGACYAVLRGGVDVRAYSAPVGRRYMARAHIKKPLERYLAPKLLVVKSTGALQATLDLEGHVVLQTLYMLSLRDQGQTLENEDELYFLLAVLNSRLLQTYVALLHTAYKWVQPQLEQHILARLPIPVIASPLKVQIISQARALRRACSQLGAVVEWEVHTQNLYEEQERTICALYASALPDLFS